MTKIIPTLSLAVSLAAFGLCPAFAQSTSGTSGGQASPAAGAQSGAGGQSGGVTSGPASPSGQQTTLGTGGVTPSTPHQTQSLRQHGGRALTSEHRGQRGGTNRSVRPSKPGSEAGPSHAAKPGQQ